MRYTDWSGKRIDWAGREYQIETVLGEARYVHGWEGRYPPSGATITGQRLADFGVVYYWIEHYIEHNAVEVSYRCGHVSVLTDEFVVECNKWCIPGLNDTVSGQNRAQWQRHIEKTFCPKCADSKIPDHLIAHLMPSDSPEAY